MPALLPDLPALPETSFWEPTVYELQTPDDVLGGPGGITNIPTTQLLNRTKFLYDRIAGTVIQAVWTRTIINASGNFVVPAGVTTCLVTIKAGGGGGAGTYDNGSVGESGPSGGEGGCAERVPITVAPGETIPVTIGAGGIGGVGSTVQATTNGLDGADTVFGAHITATKGGGALGGRSRGGLAGTVNLGSGLVLSSHAGSSNYNSSGSANHPLSGCTGGGMGGGRGGVCFLAAGGVGDSLTNGEAGANGGGGGGAAGNYVTGTLFNGGAGGPGYVIVDILTNTAIFP